MVVRLTAAFVATLASVVATGGEPSITLSILGIVGQCVLIAIVIVSWERRFGDGGFSPRMGLVYGAAGLVMLWMNRWPMLWPPLAAISMIVAPPPTGRPAAARVGRAVVAALLGYGAVWNANVLVTRIASGRLTDAWFRAADLYVYNSLGIGNGTYKSLFPLVASPWVVEALNQAYLLVMPELFVALVLIAWRGRDEVDRLLALVFASYAIGLICFLVVPAVGPCIAFPESVNRDALPAQAQIVMQGMAAGYESATTGVRQPVLAYFVAMPSLHVLLALILQRALRPFPFTAALFAPVNALVVASTVVLGYHYLLDVVAAFVLFPIMLVLCEGRRPIPTAAAL